MKNIVLKTILICALLVLLICNICYADIVFTEIEMNSLASQRNYFLAFVPLVLIIIYVIFVELLFLRSRKKRKKYIVISITLILLIFNGVIIINTIVDTPIINKIIDSSGYDNINNTKYVYVNKDNNVVIEPKEYNYAEEFSNGVAKIGYRYICRQPQHGGRNSEIEYGYINTKGDIIIPIRYHDLSYFNEEGYAYGIISFFSVPINFNTIHFFSEDNIKAYSIRFYKLDMDGNEKEISYEDFLKEKDNIAFKKGEFDEDIKLVEQVNNKYVVSKIVSVIKIVINILVLFIIPVILPIIVLIKVLKKDKKEDVASDDKKE